MKLALLAAAALVALLLAGCGDAPGNKGVVLQSNAEGKYEIHLKSGAMFLPKDAKVPVGATVVWVSDDNTAHDVTSSNGDWSSDDPPAEGGLGQKMSQGDRYERTFPTAGTYGYVCRIHSPGMTGTLTVG
jgi:plastocyanin